MEMTVEQIARVCHEANRAYCTSIGDHSQATWDMAPSWQKDSALNGVKAVLADPSVTPEALHEKWLADKTTAGWKYGPVKRPEVLEHPCMVPYDQLPAEQRLKDALFSAVVRALGKLNTASDAEVAKAVEVHEAAARLIAAPDHEVLDLAEKPPRDDTPVPGTVEAKPGKKSKK